MLNLCAIGLMGALLLAGASLLFHWAVVLRKSNAGLIAGIVAGVPVPREFRWRTFLQINVPAMAITAIVAMLVGFLFLRIADTVEDIAIATLAQVRAVPFFGIAAIGLVSVPLSQVYIARMIRRPEAD